MPADVAAALAAGQPVVITVRGTPVELSAEHLIVNEAPLSGWAVKNSAAETVALDLELTHELRLAGLARDVVRLVQEARKSAGLEVTDRIALWWRVGGSPEPAEAIRTHAPQIAGEVLATEMVEGAPETERRCARGGRRRAGAARVVAPSELLTPAGTEAVWTRRSYDRVATRYAREIGARTGGASPSP